MRTCLLLAVAVLLLGCSLGGPVEPQAVPSASYGSGDVIGVLRWIAERVYPATDLELYGVREHWATPEETLATGAGDCEDLVILALYLLDRDLGIEGAMFTGFGIRPSRNHAWLRVDGVDYEPASAQEVDYRDRYLITGAYSWDQLRRHFGI